MSCAHTLMLSSSPQTAALLSPQSLVQFSLRPCRFNFQTGWLVTLTCKFIFTRLATQGTALHCYAWWSMCGSTLSFSRTPPTSCQVLSYGVIMLNASCVCYADQYCSRTLEGGGREPNICYILSTCTVSLQEENKTVMCLIMRCALTFLQWEVWPIWVFPLRRI